MGKGSSLGERELNGKLIGTESSIKRLSKEREKLRRWAKEPTALRLTKLGAGRFS
jgi:hypothetical protein